MKNAICLLSFNTNNERSRSIAGRTSITTTAHTLNSLILFHLRFRNPTYTRRVKVRFLRLYASQTTQLQKSQLQLPAFQKQSPKRI
jgi:hypothetical protein